MSSHQHSQQETYQPVLQNQFHCTFCHFIVHKGSRLILAGLIKNESTTKVLCNQKSAIPINGQHYFIVYESKALLNLWWTFRPDWLIKPVCWILTPTHTCLLHWYWYNPISPVYIWHSQSSMSGWYCTCVFT